MLVTAICHFKMRYFIYIVSVEGTNAHPHTHIGISYGERSSFYNLIFHMCLCVCNNMHSATKSTYCTIVSISLSKALKKLVRKIQCILNSMAMSLGGWALSCCANLKLHQTLLWSWQSFRAQNSQPLSI